MGSNTPGGHEGYEVECLVRDMRPVRALDILCLEVDVEVMLMLM